MSSSVEVNNATHVAEARRVALELAQSAGLRDEVCGNCALVVTELGSNLMRHAGGGTLVLRVLSGPALEVLSLDTGPGMQDPDRCFLDGYSTGSSMGTGLGAVRRLSSAREIYSIPGQGTAVMARVGPATENPELGAISVPYPGESMCGDSWSLEDNGEAIQMTVADGLGHGPQAAEASLLALEISHNNAFVQPDQLIGFMHPALHNTRGAAVSVVLCRNSGTEIQYSGVGNVSGSVAGAGSPVRHFASMNGTAGLAIPKIQLFRYAFERGQLLVMHTDGISAKWSLDRYPGLQSAHPALVAGILFRDYRRMHDDATVVALRL